MAEHLRLQWAHLLEFVMVKLLALCLVPPMTGWLNYPTGLVREMRFSRSLDRKMVDEKEDGSDGLMELDLDCATVLDPLVMLHQSLRPASRRLMPQSAPRQEAL